MSLHSELGLENVPDIVTVENISKTFTIRKDNSLKERVVTMGRRGRVHQETFQALKDVTFNIPAGTTIGLMGPNGSGKSTLLKVIGGIIDPSGGQVRRRGRLAALLELGAGFHPDLSGRDNVYLNAAILGLSKAETDAEFDSIVAFSEIGDFIDTQVKFYSSGMYVRLAFAVAVHTNPDLLLVDEVLAVGDEAFQRKCMDKIRQFQKEGRTIVLVSHSAAQVMEVCDQGVVLSKGEVVFVGSAVDATKVQRDILEGRRKAVAEENALMAHEEPPAIASIKKIVVQGTVGENRDTVEPGSAIMIEVHVACERALDEWHSSVSIDTPNGQQVFGTGTQSNSTSHGPTPAGMAVLRYSIPELNLAGGQYFINAEVSDGQGKPMDVFWQGAMFFVPMQPRQSGLLYAKATISEA